MRTLTSIAFAVVLLAPGPAAAKGVSSAQVCGADGCQQIAQPTEGMLGGTPAAEGPQVTEPFVRLRFRFDHPGSTTVRNVFLPGSGLLLADDGSWMLPGDVAALRAAARTVEPLPAARMPGHLAPAPARPAAPAEAPAEDGRGFPWWIALFAVPIGLAVLLARRLRGSAMRTG